MYESYRSFASVYDTFMDGVDYNQWADNIQDMITRYGISKPVQKRTGRSESRDILLAAEKNLVVDLGCGTGKLTEILAGRGYDVMGIDNSVEMLNMAIERRDKLGHRTLYLCQDMRGFELYGNAGTFISAGDSINYLLSEADVEKLFKRVQLFLFPEGIFVFDFKTLHLYRDVIGDRTIAEDREDCSFIWNNWFDAGTGINEYDLSLFIRDSGGEGETGDSSADSGPASGALFRKYEEIHRQKGYTLTQMKKMASEAGLEWICEMDSETRGPVTEDSERILCVVRGQKKRS